jgi:hypothetical protein
MNLFERITQINSLNVIHWKCEEFLNERDADSITDVERVTINRILATNSLDEAWLLAYEHLGNEAEAAKLRKWILDRPKRQAMKPKNPLGDPDDYFPELE